MEPVAEPDSILLGVTLNSATSLVNINGRAHTPSCSSTFTSGLHDTCEQSVVVFVFALKPDLDFWCVTLLPTFYQF